MKTQLLVSLLQLGLLLFLIGKMAIIDDELNATFSGEYARAQEDAACQRHPDVLAGRSSDNAIESRLRTIVREELATQLAVLPRADSQNTAKRVPDPIDPTEYRYRVESVSQKLGLYESVGSILDADMEILQSEIMSLNATDRRQALSRLTRAMNSGALKGHY